MAGPWPTAMRAGSASTAARLAGSGTAAPPTVAAAPPAGQPFVVGAVAPLYDTYVPPQLQRHLGGSALVGAAMGLDNVLALLLVPISAHALFSRALVVAPTSTIAVTVDPYGRGAVVACDGRRTVDAAPGSRVTVSRGGLPVHVVRLRPRPFTDRLVAKFELPVDGWRHRRADS